VASDRIAERLGAEGDLTGVEGDLLGFVPEAGLGVLVPGQAGGVGYQAVPLGVEPALDIEGLDLAGFMAAVAPGIDALEALGRRLGGGDALEQQGRLLTWASRALPLSRAASKVFLTVQGVGGEQHAGQTQLGDHPLRRRDLVALDVDFAVRQQDRRLGGEGAQRLGRLAVGEVVEAALQGLAVECHDRHPSRFGSRPSACRRNACSRASPSRS